MNGADVGIRLIAPHTRNGNPRQVIALYRDGDLVGTVDVRYRSPDQALKEDGWTAPIASAMRVTPGTYNEYVEIGAIMRGEKRARVRRVRLDRGGYAPDGQYFGIGTPLWRVETDDGEYIGHVRASDREFAVKKAKTTFKVRL